MRISLTEEMETLLIPLYGRAQMSKTGLFYDEDAEHAVAQINYDFSRLHIQQKTQVMLSIRGMLIDDATKMFLREHPDSTVLYLGCGLDARAKRLGFPADLWYDLDFPQVIELKKQLFEETEHYKYIPSSVTDWDWMDQVADHGRPVLVIAEGLLMYLSGQEVETLLFKLRDRFKDVTMIFDAYSGLTARHAKNHPSLKQTGASIQWGIDSPSQVEAFGDGIIHQKTLYLTDAGAVRRLPIGYRMMFRFAGRFHLAKEAHRIFIFNLICK